MLEMVDIYNDWFADQLYVVHIKRQSHTSAHFLVIDHHVDNEASMVMHWFTLRYHSYNKGNTLSA